MASFAIIFFGNCFNFKPPFWVGFRESASPLEWGTFLLEFGPPPLEWGTSLLEFGPPPLEWDTCLLGYNAPQLEWGPSLMEFEPMVVECGYITIKMKYQELGVAYFLI